MFFKLDENVPRSCVQVLASAGHDVKTAGDEGLLGAPDPRVMSACAAEGRVLVTLDLDFADITAYPPGAHSGIIVLRLHRQDAPAIVNALTRCLTLFKDEAVAGHLWIVEDAQVRIRGGDPRA